MSGRDIPESIPPRFYGLGVLDKSSNEEYCYWDNPEEINGVSMENATNIPDPLGLRKMYHLEGEAIQKLWSQVAPLATNYIENYYVPITMRLNEE
ncbi:hypothetical protein FJZ33_09040 [Candidatus Poribacteria bacterium]|nr:hypothetical protein [Candidatus Poribacteria bacterium]